MRLPRPALAALLLLLSASGCLGGQTGDPTAASGPPGSCPIDLESALDVVERFEGSYSAPVVRSEAPPEACVSADTTLHLEVESVLDDDELREKPCGAAWLPVSLHVWTEDQELDSTLTGWLAPTGDVSYQDQEVPPDVPSIRLLDPPNFEVTGNGLWTLAPCCFDGTCP